MASGELGICRLWEKHFTVQQVVELWGWSDDTVRRTLCHEQVPAGDIEDQTLGTGQIGRRYFADGYFAEDKPNSMNAV
jgi:hypothetical protein